MPTEKAICENPRCARTYTKKRGIQKYCSARCRIQVANSHIHKGKICRWCGEHFKVTYKTKSINHCSKPACTQRQWYWHFLQRYRRCIACQSIISSGKQEWRSTLYCAFDVGSVRKDVKERYVEWLQSLPRYVEALLPNPPPKQKDLFKYVKAYNINNLKFQTFCPYKEKEND